MKRPRRTSRKSSRKSTPKGDFSLPLPKPVGPFKTLDDVRKGLLAIGEAGKMTEPWEKIGHDLLEAAKTGDTQPVYVGLQILKMHGIF